MRPFGSFAERAKSGRRPKMQGLARRRELGSDRDDSGGGGGSFLEESTASIVRRFCVPRGEDSKA